MEHEDEDGQKKMKLYGEMWKERHKRNEGLRNRVRQGLDWMRFSREYQKWMLKGEKRRCR